MAFPEVTNDFSVYCHIKSLFPALNIFDYSAIFYVLDHVLVLKTSSLASQTPMSPDSPPIMSSLSCWLLP